MRLQVIRKHFFDNATIGELHVDGVFECYTLEDKVRNLAAGELKVYGQTAIPEGSYTVALTMSNRFKRVLPLINHVPQFEGVRIHPGNTSADTEGCILVGSTMKLPNFIGNSRAAFDKLFAKLQKQQSITITIVNGKK